ncbi:alginate lyase family protein [Maribacter polysaccharolyticus]|uniref:alginate lyase family protein n=1 Tax=Maribacter polysaccharolyticus TaxID=3020831 RepID=UPI00237F0C40|nr:alginate lyase family protein [Maribacter polysaccharolyticus]MDE3742812.1 alginate lyase family protein [Maribacter polysaccharolyticus]
MKKALGGRILFFCSIVCLLFGIQGYAQEHPNLILTKAGVEKIRAELGSIPIFDTTLKQVQEEVDAEIALGIHTPIPKDYSGGYTHERHKRNFIILQKAGVLFQILEDEKYAIYIRDMLFQYEAMYKDLPVHPKERSYARGKLFWQCLNDSNWLVYVSQAYDCVYDWLSSKERKKLEKNLFRPFADFISVGNPQFYNRIHNHSTWGNAAVGMIGLVMGDDELIARALYGIKDAKLDINAKDNDGGFIFSKDKKAGFLANLDEPFSPDGYYTEGPYYQRYAMYPFLIFAEGLQNVRPELNIFAHKDSVLLKSVDALLNLSDKDGEFFPLNDGQKGMSYYSRELVTAVDIAYHFGGNNPGLLSIAKKQDQVVLDDTGLSVALGLKENREQPFVKKSILLSDGPEGNEGGVGILRYGQEELSLVFKYAAQGLSHGHYDKLSYSLYDQGDEVLQDYGLARFVNIEQKGGGNYLKENKTWAKQTVAHNTVVQNMVSHFNGKYEIGSQHHSELVFSNITDPDFQIISAKEENAYPGTLMHRTLVMIKDPDYERPFVLDIFNIISDKENQYDLPFNFMGQVMKANFEYETPSSLQALGDDNGYQHLWLEAKGNPLTENTKLSFLNQGRFYTLTTTAEGSDELLFTRLGANDPEFNLRRDASFIVRRKAQNTAFVSVIEPHGGYSPVSEFAVNSNSNIENLTLVGNDENYTGVSIKDKNGHELIVVISNNDASSETIHELNIDNTQYKWSGPFNCIKIKKQ